MGRLVRINPATEEKNSQAAVVATGAHGHLVRTGDVQRTSPADNTVKLPSRETERADELDKRTTPSKSRQGQNRSFGERLAKAAGSGLVAEGANLANLGGVAADRRGGTEMSTVYRRQAETLDKQIAALEKTLKDPTMTAQDIRETNEALAIARSEREKYGKVIESGEKTALGLYDTADKGYSLAEKWGEESTAGTKGIEKGALKIVPAAMQIGLQVAERAIAPGLDVAGRALSAAGANAADYRHKAGEQYDKEKAALRATVSALGVAAGGALSKGVNAAGLKLLRAAGKQNHILPNVLLGGANAVGYAAGETGASELSKAMTEEDYTPDWGAIGQTAMTAFAFGAITSAINAAAMTGRNKHYMNELNDAVKERYDYAKRIIEDPRATAGQKAAGAESVMNAADKMRGALDELQVVGAQKEVDAMREFLLSIYGEMMPYTGAGSAGAGTAGIVPVTLGGGIMAVRPGEGANLMQEAAPTAPITPRAAGAAAAVQNSVPAQSAAAQEGVQGVGEGNLTPVPQNAAQDAQEAKADALDAGGRVPLDQYATPENAQQVSQEINDGTLAVDSHNKIYRVDAGEHIDRRDNASVGERSVNAFQFDHPELHQYFAEAAADLSEEMSFAQRGGELVRRTSREAGDDEYIRTKRGVSERIARLLDDEGVRYDDIDRSIEAIIHNHGQENFAAAKRVELLLDEMLTNGYTDIHGRYVAPNERYIEAKRAIPGADTSARTREELPLWDMAEGKDGGIYGGQEVQNHAGGAEFAEAGERAGLPDGNGRRDNGASTGEQIGSVGGGRPQRAADQSRTALERQNRARDLRLEKVSSAELGVRMGTDEKSVTVLPESEWDDELRDVARRIEWETGKKTTMVVGSIRIRTDRGARSVRGVWTRDGIIIRADNMRISAEQIADHEIFHEYADQNPGLIQAVERSIREKYGDQEFDRIVESYIRNLRGIIDIDENAAGYEVEQALLDVKNEILADAYADINAFGEKAGKYQENVRQTLRERGIVDTGRETAAATERRTGPPERFSVQRTQNIPYQEQIDAFYEGDLKTVGRSDDIYVTGADGSPDALGLGGKPFFVLKRNLQKITRKEGANKNYSAHGIGEDIIRDLPDMLRDPAMVIVGDDRISVIPGRAVETAREKAAPLLIGVNPNGSVDGRSAYEIKTMYGREGFADWLGLRATDSRIIAGNKNKATALLRNVGIKITEPVAYAADLTNAILSQSQGDVKYSAFNEEVARQLAGEEPEKTKFSAEDEGDGRYLADLNDKSIEERKKSISLDEAINELYRQKGLSYRFYSSDDPMSRAGYAMFADEPDRAGSGYGGDEKRAFSVEESSLTDISDIKEKIIEARHNTDENTPWELEDYEDVDDDSFAELFDPEDIVDSAAAYDDESLVSWLWNNVLEPNDIAGIKTSDGAVAFSPDIIKRNLAAEIAFGRSNEDDVRFSAEDTTDSTGRELTAQQREYFKDSKVRDEQGRLMTLYHGTTAYGEFTKFRRGRSGWLGPGIYLTNNLSYAERYANSMGEGNGHLYKLYANAINPLVVHDGNPVPEILFAAYGRKSVYKNRSAKQSNDAMIITTADIKKLREKGYDGIRWDFGKSTELSVFSPEQIKNVSNETPTDDPDIRFSAEDEDGDEWNRELERMPESVQEAVRRVKGSRGSSMREFPNLDAYLSGERGYTAEAEDFYRRADEELADRAAEREREEERTRWVRERKREAAQERAYAKAERDAKREDAGNLKPTNKTAAPAAASKPTIAKNDLREAIEDMFSIPGGERREVGKIIDQCADSILKNGALTQDERERFLNRMYAAGVVQTEGLLRAAGEYIAPRRVYVDKNERALFGEDWNSFRTRASAAGITLLVRMPENGNATGVDALRAGLAEQLPTVFDPRETSARETLERMVQLAEEGKDENLSLGEYISEVAGKDFIREKQLYDELERKMDDALRTFAEKADLETRLRDRASTKIAQERERFNQMRQTERAAQKERESAQKAKDQAENEERERKARERDLMRKADAQERRIEAARRRRENREMKELQQKTLKQLQWLSKNRNRAPEAMKDAWDEVLGDIDIYATSAANEMHWSDKHQATWGDLAQMYKDAQKNDPNFLPSKELEHIVHRLDDEKIADMDIDALQNLYKAAVGLRTEFYNRNNVIADEEHALFSELYSDAKQELRAAGRQSEPTGAKGAFDKYANDWQLTPMNTLERMAGWNRDSKWFKMAKQLEKGEREKRRYEVKAKRQLSGWLAENAEWVKKADGQGDDAIWYEVEVPELLELGMGDKPIFGDTIKVYMTPAQKVHMYLESKSYENLRHMAGGRTFADKELYSKGKRMEAFAKGKTVKLAPETVKKLTEDLTPEERELARLLEGYYNKFASGEINRVSNILYGYDKAVSKNYAPIYTNSNYVKSEPGVYNATAEGVGNLKPRQHSKNPSYNIGAFDAFEKHVDQTARFVGMAIPVRNWNTLMGWRDGKDSMADVVTHEWGLDAKTFIEKLLTELQDGKQSEQGKADRLISKALSNYISSVFGFNPSIVLKQAASFPLAAAYLDPKDMPNIRKALKVDDELIETYTSELSYRLLGYATPETAMLKNHPGKLQEKGVLNFVFGGGAITAMDGATVKTLWSWAEKKVQREHPELEKGTEEQIKRGESPFYQKVAEEFEEATSRSQPMYDVMHRSNIMRDSSGITRTFTLFKTVPQQEYNMLRQAMGEAEYHKKNGSDAKTQKEAKKKVGRVVMSILAGNLMLGTITFLNSMAKNKGKRYRDENGELTPESVMKQFLQQFMYDSLGVAIFGDTASELIGSALTGDKWYGIETPGIEQLNEMLEECKDACRLIPKTLEESGNVLANGGSWAQYMKDNSSVYLSAIEEIAETVATYLGGLPAENVKGYFLGMMKWIAPGAETEIEDLFDRPDKQGLKELDGRALETRVKNLLNDRVGNAPDEAVRRIARLYESGYTDAAPSATPSYVTIDKVKHELDAGKTQKYENAWRKAIGGELSEMVRLPAFIRADEETQEKMLKKLYSYASDMAKAEVFKEYEMKKSTMEMSDLAKHGLSVAVQIVAAVSGENDPKGLSLPTP